MVNNKLFRLLSSFEPFEIKALEKFILSPLHLEGKRPLKVQSLLQCLTTFYPEFNQPELQDENLYGIIFPDEPFNKGKWDKICSNATKTLQNFIAFISTSEFGEIDNLIIQLRFYNQRNLEKDFVSTYKKASKFLAQIQRKGKEYHQRKFYLEKEYFDFQLKSNDKKSIDQLAEVITRLDQYFFIYRLQFSYYLLTKSVSTKAEIKPLVQLLDSILDMVKRHYLQTPLLEIFYHTYELLPNGKPKNSEYISKLEDSLNRLGDKIPHDELLSIHNFMRNFLANQYIHGDQSSLPKLFNLIKDQVQQKTIYFDGNRIYSSTLQNAITVALKLNEPDWALDFLETHRDRIQGADSKEDLYRFHLADIYFHKGNYALAQQTLDKFHFRELYYNLAVRRLEVKLNYETSDSLYFLESRLLALKSLIYDHQKWLPKDKFAANNNFFKTVYQLFKILEENEKLKFQKEKLPLGILRKIETIKKTIQEEQFLAEREWLKIKINDLNLKMGGNMERISKRFN